MSQSIAIDQSPFNWEGTDSGGKRVKGKTVATSEAAVRAELRRKGIVPLRVRKETVLFQKRGKVTTADIAIFSRQLATMLSAGIPLVQAFEIVGAGHDNLAMRKLIYSVKQDVEGGNALAEALAKHPLHFDDLFVNLVEAGEQAGALETLLDKIATYKEKTEAIKKKIKKALTYPAAVIVVALIVTTILLIFVIPEFETLFQGFGADLPAFTRIIINLSEFVRDRGWLLVILSCGAVAGYLAIYKRSRPLRELQDRVTLKLPIIGNILEKAAIARYARTLSTMFAAGVPLVEALESVAGATGNIVFEIATMAIRDEVSTGQRLQRAMENTKLFPNMVIQMIAVGEESGSLDDMSSKVADFYEEDVDNAVDNMSSLLEPIIMSILGVLVGGLVVAMYLPIFKMGAVI
ncbi:MAG: type II secretion system F family protein [Gammaproteobacteria bacterium]|jgi:type IV pilus assembly protein PilC|nr:type II secretion system protein F [Chromatiales bacterium]MCP4926838.1 type II secretion system F family protein [Gammaproteobacteria bacterium]MDP7296441.1 type II secretion system F family protein [Gammaproteobacteria bacterium]MDP7420189.1 type II secretion system F family protein [Gammaproteobacteria bacterium]MDP7661048.1 type II secretion system F family protein [Gammaproteobacteria bacterium]